LLLSVIPASATIFAMKDPRIQFVLLGAAAGAAIALGSVWMAQRTEIAPPPAAVTVGNAISGMDEAGTAIAGTAIDFSPVLRRLDDVAARLERLESKVAEFRSLPARTPVAGTPTPVQLDADTVLAAMEAAQQKKIDALSDQELRQEARRLEKGGDNMAAQQRLETLLQRALTPENRARAQTELGMLLRNRGDAESVASAVAMFQSVIDANGLASEVGSQAGLQLVWTDAKGSDAGRGMAQAELLVRTPGVPIEIVRNARWATGILAQNLGDTARARSEYESLLRDLQGQTGQEKLVEDIRRRLAGL
jgi:tetratricopeptide (TPR) repeat protein